MPKPVPEPSSLTARVEIISETYEHILRALPPERCMEILDDLVVYVSKMAEYDPKSIQRITQRNQEAYVCIMIATLISHLEEIVECQTE